MTFFPYLTRNGDTYCTHEVIAIVLIVWVIVEIVRVLFF